MSSSSKILKRTQFGNPVLREVAKTLSREQILSETTQELIKNMKNTLLKRKYGIGLAATQVGQSLAITVIGIKPTPVRPKLPKISMVVINPKIINKHGKKEPMWEGCISLEGSFAQVPRYKKIEVEYYDQKAKMQKKVLDGILAHVFQHEVDHLNGVLFVDRVEDTKSYMSTSEYRKMVKKQNKQD